MFEIPVKKPCPCGCPKFLLAGLCDCQCSTKSAAEADEIIEVYKDAARMRFLLEHRALLAPLHHIKMHDQRAWIDKQMEKTK